MPKDWTPIRGADIQINRRLYELGFLAVAPKDFGHRYLKTSISTLGRTFEMAGEVPTPILSPRDSTISTVIESEEALTVDSSSTASCSSSPVSLSPSSLDDPEFGKFLLGDTPFSLVSQKPLSRQSRAEQKASLMLLSKLVNFANTKHREMPTITTSTSSTSPQPVQKLTEMRIGETVLFNPKRKAEVFLPLSITHGSEGPHGIYANIWPSTNAGRNHIDFHGFTQFVTAGCLFGASLFGIDNKGYKQALIKHDLEFHSESQQFVAIQYLPNKLHPYEAMTFFQLKIMASSINSLATVGTRPRVFYHLPYYDYMLFGMELFIRKRITFEALSDLFDAILQRANIHSIKIQKISKKYDVDILIESPFKNIFGNLSAYDEENILALLIDRHVPLPEKESIEYERLIKETRATLILEKMSICTTAEVSALVIANEADLVALCLQKLATNEYDIEHRQVWTDFLRVLDPTVDRVETLEDLFKLANTIIVGIATKESAAYSTCSFLSLAEKQIQVEYAKVSKKLNASGVTTYSPTINLTTLDPILSYDNTSKANAFYFNETARGLSRLIKKTDVLDRASRNISFFSQGSKTIPLESAAGKDFVRSPKIPRN